MPRTFVADRSAAVLGIAWLNGFTRLELLLIRHVDSSHPSIDDLPHPFNDASVPAADGTLFTPVPADDVAEDE
jgi:hypothetical protein